MSISYGSIPASDDATTSSKHELRTANDTIYGTKFRYIIFGLLLACVTMSCYSNATLYISAIEMISSDVLNKELTQLRLRHRASLEWLHVPMPQLLQPAGTCPLDPIPGRPPHTPNAAGFQGSEGPHVENVSRVIRLDAALLARDTQALIEDVKYRVSRGQLVDWSIEQRGLVFSAARVGVILSGIPLSWLGLRYGSKRIASLGIVACAVHTLLLPTVAGHLPFWAMLVFEFASGCLSYGMLTVLYPFVAAWYLPHEASAFVALSNVCSLVGSAMNDFISTQMLAHQIPWSWLFYLSGICNALLWIAWMVLSADRPEKCRFVTREELAILQNSMSAQNKAAAAAAGNGQHQAVGPHECCMCDSSQECPARIIKREPAWAKLIGCPIMWTVIGVSFASQWALSADNLAPTFFANILHWPAATIGLVMSAKGAFALVYGTMFAYATRRFSSERPFKMHLTAFRRLCQLLATLTDVARVVLRVVFDCSLVANSLSLLLGVMVNNFDVISYNQMLLDLSPEDSGLLASWVRLFTLSDFMSVPVSGLIISASTGSRELPNGDRHAWRLVWILCTMIKLAACIFFVGFARAEPRTYSRAKPAGPCKSRTLLRRISDEQP